MGKMFAIHELELRPGISGDDFERFMQEEGLKLLPPIAGQRTYLLKGDRGHRAGKYAFLIEFESTEARDRLFPEDGVASEEAQQYFGSEVVQRVLATWGTLSTSPGNDTVWTDYMSIPSRQ